MLHFSGSKDPPALCLADIVAVPTLPEGFGLVTEAMAMETPVVTFNWGEAQTLSRYYTGFLASLLFLFFKNTCN